VGRKKKKLNGNKATWQMELGSEKKALVKKVVW